VNQNKFVLLALFVVLLFSACGENPLTGVLGGEADSTQQEVSVVTDIPEQQELKATGNTEQQQSISEEPEVDGKAPDQGSPLVEEPVTDATPFERPASLPNIHIHTDHIWRCLHSMFPYNSNRRF
jgi:hypothetical protein